MINGMGDLRYFLECQLLKDNSSARHIMKNRQGSNLDIHSIQIIFLALNFKKPKQNILANTSWVWIHQNTVVQQVDYGFVVTSN